MDKLNAKIKAYQGSKYNLWLMAKIIYFKVDFTLTKYILNR